MENLIEQDLSRILPLLSRPQIDKACDKHISLFESKKIWSVAKKNKISSILVESFDKCCIDNKIPEEFVNQYDKQSAIISKYLIELDKIGLIFKERQLPIIVLENGAIAHSIYPNCGCYSFGDLDLLLDPQHFGRASEILQENGYELLTSHSSDNASGFNLTTGRVEYLKSMDDDLCLRLNIQPAFVARKWFFSESEPDYNTLLHRSILSGHSIHILGREDFLFQLCLHNASHCYIRKPGIRLHLDIDWYIRSVFDEIDWPNFVNLVRQLHVNTLTYFSLLIPKTIFGTPVPDDVLAALRPPVWKEKMIRRTLSKGNLLAPEKQQFSRVGFLLFNIFIYDNFFKFLRAFVPSRECLIERYGLMENQSRFRFLFKHYTQGAFGRK